MRTGLVCALLLLGFGGCATLEKSAAKDPMKCERNPDCAATRSRYRDCSTQCSDDPACMDRCREIEDDHLGHR